MMTCKYCEHCFFYAKRGNTRYEVYCRHPNEKYINDYFREHKISKYPTFLGYTKRQRKDCPVKTAPAWCPLKAEEGKNDE